MIRFLFTILLTVCLTQVASEIYAPAMPAMAAGFQSPVELTQWSMAVYMWGVSFSQLIYGPLSEGYGRKKPLLAGLAIMLAGSLICTVAPTIHWLIGGRLLQGIGAGSAAALWRAIFRDRFHGAELAKIGSYFGMLIVLVIPLAPLMGSYLESAFGWRSCFTFMTLYAAIALSLIYFGIEETNLHRHRERLSWRFVKTQYLTLLASPVFMGTTLASCLSYGAFFAWFVTGPILFIEAIGITPIQFGWLIFWTDVLAYVIGGIWNGRFVKSLGSARMLQIGWNLMLGAGAAILLSECLFGVSFWGLLLPLFFFSLGTSLIWPNVYVAAFAPFGHIAGYAGALYGFLQLGGGALFGSIMSTLSHTSAIPLALVMMGCTLAAWAFYALICPDRIEKRSS